MNTGISKTSASYTSSMSVAGREWDSYSPLAQIFFSNENLELIQKKLVLEVFKKTNVRIPFQSKDQIIIVMRAVFNTYALNRECDYQNQIRDLDDRVIIAIITDVVSSIELSLVQRDTVNRGNAGRTLLDLPINISKKQSLPGERQQQQPQQHNTKGSIPHSTDASTASNAQAIQSLSRGIE
jgi:hypothetical protein